MSAKPAAVPCWLSDMERPFRPVAEILAEAEAAEQQKAQATGQGRNRAAGTYRNRAMTTNPGKEG